MTPGPLPGTVRCADCDWSVAAVEALAWRELAAHRAQEHDDESPCKPGESDAKRGRMGTAPAGNRGLTTQTIEES